MWTRLFKITLCLMFAAHVSSVKRPVGAHKITPAPLVAEGEADTLYDGEPAVLSPLSPPPPPKLTPMLPVAAKDDRDIFLTVRTSKQLQARAPPYT